MFKGARRRVRADRYVRLRTPSRAYKPFRYPWAYEFWKKQQQVHWLPEEVPLGEDCKDWSGKLSDGDLSRLSVGWCGDDITPKDQVFSAEPLLGSREVVKVLAPGGHIGLFMSHKVLETHWPAIAAWLAKS